jgi:hypothetical protein
VSASGWNSGAGSQPDTRRVAILGAAGRDFHNFNVVYRDNPRFEVVAFTAAQIPAPYEFAEAQTPGLGDEIDRYLARAGLASSPL